LDERLGAGAFGEIYSGIDTESGEPVAVKLERVDAEHPQLTYEARVYQQLASKRGVPQLYYVGREGNYNVMVMERLGSNLETLLTQCGRRFSLCTVLEIADKMLQLVQKVHDQGFVHRDLKPDNFVTGMREKGDEGDLYIIDFGLSKCFWDPDKDEHIPFRSDKHLTGTARYASIGNHRGLEQSRRDDLESLGYLLVYFLRGELPWQGVKGKSRKVKYNKMMDLKKDAHQHKTLCQGLPAAFQQYFDYVLALRFEERPDYTLLRNSFKRLARECGFIRKAHDPPLQLDWQKPENVLTASATTTSST
jgi:serine/threonine protein kinase